MIPDYTRDGLLPAGEHESSWAEFVERYEGTADNGRRRKLMLGLAQMLVLLERAGGRTVLVDGSFVTRERWPRDFDACYFPSEVSDEIAPILVDMSHGRRAQKLRFGGEIMPFDLPFSWNGETVLQAFTRDRSGVEKGLIRLDLSEIAPALWDWIAHRQGEQKFTQENGEAS